MKGKEIKKLIWDLGLKQKDICQELKILDSTLSMALNEKRSFPKGLKEKVLNYIKKYEGKQ